MSTLLISAIPILCYIPVMSRPWCIAIHVRQNSIHALQVVLVCSLCTMEMGFTGCRLG